MNNQRVLLSLFAGQGTVLQKDHLYDARWSTATNNRDLIKINWAAITHKRDEFTCDNLIICALRSCLALILTNKFQRTDATKL